MRRGFGRPYPPFAMDPWPAASTGAGARSIGTITPRRPFLEVSLSCSHQRARRAAARVRVGGLGARRPARAAGRSGSPHQLSVRVQRAPEVWTLVVLDKKKEHVQDGCRGGFAIFSVGRCDASPMAATVYIRRLRRGERRGGGCGCQRGRRSGCR